MIKLLIFVALAYLAYRLFIGAPLLEQRKTPHIRNQENDDDGFVDYEEID